MNVIVIMLDSLRADYVGAYGNKWIKTPNIDWLSQKGVTYLQATTEAPITLPARNALLTGRYTFPYQGWGAIQNYFPRLPQVLHNSGYLTALIADTTPIQWPGMNFHRGFDYVKWLPKQWGDWRTHNPEVLIDPMQLSKWKSVNPSKSSELSNRLFNWWKKYLHNIADREKEEDYFPARIFTTAAEFIEAHYKEKFFLWIDSFDPHEPWDPPYPYDEMYYPEYMGKTITLPEAGEIDFLTKDELKHIKALYAGEITLVDKYLGRFFDKVRQLGLLDNTIIVLLSDHGEPLGEHGIILKCRPWPYREVSQIPLIIYHPSKEMEGVRTSVLAQTPDIAPTILRLVNVPVPKSVQGLDIWSPVKDNAGIDREYSFIGYYQGPIAIQTEEWKYIQFNGARESQLFNLHEDPQEKRNVIDKFPDLAKKFEKALNNFMREKLSEKSGGIGETEEKEKGWSFFW